MMILEVKKREIFGKKVKSLRRAGFIPAELYGRDFPNEHLAVEMSGFSKIFKEAGESVILNLKIKEDENEKNVNVLIHDVSRDPLTDKITHIDFYQVRMDEKLTAGVPIRFIGEAPAVKEKNGILVRAMQEIEVEALPADLPHDIEVNVGRLRDIGASLYVRDLEPIAGVKFLIEPETVIATVIEPAKEEIEEKPINVEEVKVEGQEKKEKAAAETTEKIDNKEKTAK